MTELKVTGMSCHIASDENLSPYQKEWETLFSGNCHTRSLHDLAMNGSLKNFPFRSICWKIFLKCLPNNQNTWIDVTKSQRQEYEKIVDKYYTDPRTFKHSAENLQIHNPLSQSHQSPWNQYFQDTELKLIIQQDVVRTFPEIEFYQAHFIQRMMLNILFSYAREFPHVLYKQGMHEILAPIIFVLHYDQQAYLHTSETDELATLVHVLLDQAFIEHDAFFLFKKLMESVESWYSVGECWDMKYLKLTPEPFSQTPAVHSNSVGRKLKIIYEKLLKQHDIELFSFLNQMEITPQIFGIRWLRLLFGREFSLHDLLIVWDAIFADSITFELVDYIFIAMLISMRDTLLQSDYASCLSYLMRFPGVVNVQYIIDLALHLRDPSSYKKPEGNCMLNPLHMKILQDGKQSFNKGLTNPVKSSSSKSVDKPQTTSKNDVKLRPKSLSITGVNMLRNNSAESKVSGTRSKSSSLNEKFVTQDSILNSDFEESNSFQNESLTPVEKKNNYFTLPRTRIRNVMESHHHKFRASDLGKNSDNSKTLPLNVHYKEMVPLSSTTKKLTALSLNKIDQIEPKVLHEKNRQLVGNSQLDAMLEYCSHQITLHVQKLQGSLIQQHLQFEDEVFLALAGLKRVRDILNGTVNFTEEVLGNDINPYTAISCTNSSNTRIIGKKCFEYVQKDNSYEIEYNVNDEVHFLKAHLTKKECIQSNITS